jgi:UDP-N-acetylmuramate--alanine ligase
VALELDIPWASIQAAMKGFGGVDRRFSERGEVQDILLIDDYGHHPVEIQATLAAAAEGYEDRRIVAVFQPHRYTRVQALFQEFAQAFHRASVVLVCPIYAAGEKPISGIDSAAIAAALKERGHRGVIAVASLDAAQVWLAENLKSGDLCITLGAGDVNRILAPLAASLAEDRARDHG